MNLEIAENEEDNPSPEDSQEIAVPEEIVPDAPTSDSRMTRPVTTTTVEPRRSSRTRKPTERYAQYLAGNFAKASEDIPELQTVEEALRSEHTNK